MNKIFGAAVACLGMALLAVAFHPHTQASKSTVALIADEVKGEITAVVGLALFVGGIYLPHCESIPTESNASNREVELEEMRSTSIKR